MRIASPAAEHPVAGEPAGWSPGPVAPGRSTRASGLLRGGFDAWRGVAERGEGAALTDVQQALLAPLLARATQLPEALVQADLARVRIVLGGPADGAGNVATTIGHHVYVSDAAHATRMLSWSGRRWLVHELVHTMQWRRFASPAASDAQRDRSFLNEYVGSFVAHDGSLAAGGFLSAIREWRRRREAGEPGLPLGDLLHDSHPMEREAERVAVAFAQSSRT